MRFQVTGFHFDPERRTLFVCTRRLSDRGGEEGSDENGENVENRVDTDSHSKEREREGGGPSTELGNRENGEGRGRRAVRRRPDHEDRRIAGWSKDTSRRGGPARFETRAKEGVRIPTIKWTDGRARQGGATSGAARHHPASVQFHHSPSLVTPHEECTRNSGRLRDRSGRIRRRSIK